MTARLLLYILALTPALALCAAVALMAWASLPRTPR